MRDHRIATNSNQKLSIVRIFKHEMIFEYRPEASWYRYSYIVREKKRNQNLHEARLQNCRIYTAHLASYPHELIRFPILKPGLMSPQRIIA